MEKFIPLLSVLLWAALWSAGGFLILVNTIKTQRHETTLLGWQISPAGFLRPFQPFGSARGSYSPLGSR